MTKKILINSIYVIFLSIIAILQIAFFSAWNGFFSSLNLIIIFLVFILFFYNLKAALIAAFIFAFWLEIFSFNFFGIFIISLLLTLYIIEKLSFSWLTNRSLYSFIILNIVAVLIYQLISQSILYFSDLENSRFLIFTSAFWLNAFYQIFWSFLISIFSFNFMIAFNDRYRPDFLGGKMKSL